MRTNSLFHSKYIGIVAAFIIVITNRFTVHAVSGTDIVYVTPTGTKYHNENCSYIQESCTAITRTNAVSRGYEPCSRCDPDILNLPYEAPENNDSYSTYNSSSQSRAQNNTETPKINRVTAERTPDNELLVTIEDAQESNTEDNRLKLIGILSAGTLCITPFAYTSNRRKKENIELKKKIEEIDKSVGDYRSLLSFTNKQLQISQAQVLRLRKANQMLMSDDRLERIIKDLSALPNNVKFTRDGKPYDAATNGKYGSYTVYISKNGSRFHRKKGCSGATEEAHIFDMPNKYMSPCRNCCKGQEEIPDWYVAYRTLFDLLK